MITGLGRNRGIPSSRERRVRHPLPRQATPAGSSFDRAQIQLTQSSATRREREENVGVVIEHRGGSSAEVGRCRRGGLGGPRVTREIVDVDFLWISKNRTPADVWVKR